MSRRWKDLPADERPSAHEVAAAIVAAARLFDEEAVLKRALDSEGLMLLSHHCRMLAGQLLRVLFDRLSHKTIGQMVKIAPTFLDDVAFRAPRNYPVARRREQGLTLWLGLVT
jgi:hypothetical protein